MADLLERTATQARMPDGAVHVLKAAEAGRMYWTRCGALLLGADGAMLTTRYATCETCTAGKGSATASGSPGRRDGGAS